MVCLKNVCQSCILFMFINALKAEETVHTLWRYLLRVSCDIAWSCHQQQLANCSALSFP